MRPHPFAALLRDLDRAAAQDPGIPAVRHAVMLRAVANALQAARAVVAANDFPDDGALEEAIVHLADNLAILDAQP